MSAGNGNWGPYPGYFDGHSLDLPSSDSSTYPRSHSTTSRLIWDDVLGEYMVSFNGGAFVPLAGVIGNSFKVKVSSTDTTPDFLLNKLESTGGLLAITKVNGGANEKVNLNVLGPPGGPGLVVVDDTGGQSVLSGPSVATLVYNYNLAGFSATAKTNAGLLSAATQAYDTGFGPMIQSTNGASSSDCEYGLGIAATKIIISGKTVRNDLSGGTGTMSFHATRNGVIVATLDVTEGAGSQDPTTLTMSATIAAGAITDTFGLSFTNGTGAGSGAFTGSISLTVLAV